MFIAVLIVVTSALVIGALWLFDLERRLVALEGGRSRTTSDHDSIDKVDEQKATRPG